MVTENLEYCVDDCEGCRRAHKDFDARECCQTRNTVKKHSAEFAVLGPEFRKLVETVEALTGRVKALEAKIAEPTTETQSTQRKTEKTKSQKA